MFGLTSAWANVQWMVFQWISAWWNDINGAITFMERIGQ